MFSHIQIGARDLPKMVAFYDAVLGCLGLERIEGEHDSLSLIHISEPTRPY